MSEASCFFLFSYVRKFSSFIVHHFRIIHIRAFPNNSSCFRFASQPIISGYSISSGNMSESFYFLCSIISENFRHSYFMISGLLCISEKIPSCFQFVSQSIIAECFCVVF